MSTTSAMSASIIDIKSEDILDSLENILHNSKVFKTNRNVNNINCTIFYFDNNNMISYQKSNLEIKNNCLSKTELMKLILNNNKYHSNSFDLTGIYKFEVNLQEDKIKSFCGNPENSTFLEKYGSIQDITFSPCIKIFNDFNGIYLFFAKKSKTSSAPEVEATQKKNVTRKKVKFQNTPKVMGSKEHTKTSKKYD